MARLNLMRQPFACVVTSRESDLTAADGLRPAMFGYSFFRLVAPYGVLIGDVCGLSATTVCKPAHSRCESFILCHSFLKCDANAFGRPLAADVLDEGVCPPLICVNLLVRASQRRFEVILIFDDYLEIVWENLRPVRAV